jgi:hypothetical protein
MAKPSWKYRPPRPGPLHLRESVRRPLLALLGADRPEARLEVARVEAVERALRCELPNEILACFANGDPTLPEWGFDLGRVADHTTLARELGCRASLIAVGECPDGHILYCIERRGERQRPVGLVELDTEENGGVGWCDLGSWLAELAGLEVEADPRPAPTFVQLTLWPEVVPEPRAWRLVE